MMLRNLAVLVSAQLVAIACTALTPTQQRDVTNTAATIERCQEEGRACKADGGSGCYTACMQDAGLK